MAVRKFSSNFRKLTRTAILTRRPTHSRCINFLAKRLSIRLESTGDGFVGVLCEGCVVLLELSCSEPINNALLNENTKEQAIRRLAVPRDNLTFFIPFDLLGLKRRPVHLLI